MRYGESIDDDDETSQGQIPRLLGECVLSIL